MTKKENKELRAIALRNESAEAVIEWQEETGIDCVLSPYQVLDTLKPTPEEWVRERVVGKTKTGKEVKAKYVPNRYFLLEMNKKFGWNWDFEILGEIISADEVVVKGKLTVRTKNGQIVKTQYGRKKLVGQTQSKGDQIKAAATDCFKKCCLQLQMFADVYSQEMAIEDARIIKDIAVQNGEYEEYGEYGEPIKHLISKNRKINLEQDDSKYFHPLPSSAQLKMVKAIFEKLHWKVEKPIEKLTRKEASSIIERGIKSAKQKGIRLVEKELPTIQVGQTEDDIPVIDD